MEGGNSGSRAERFLQEQLAIQRKNLLGVCKMCIKSLVDKAAFEAITEDCSHLSNFCTIMEHILTHRLQVRWSLFSGSEGAQFWPVVSRLAPSITVSSVQDMEGILTDLGRGRAWIRLMLVQKKLSHFMSSLLSKVDTLQAAYFPGAFLLSDELTEIAGTMKCLDTIDFNLCLRGQDFDFGEKREINFSSYLLFNQSVRGRVDDFMEEQKLKSPSSERVPFPWQPEVWGGNSNGPGGGDGGGGGGEGGEGAGVGEGGETAAQLREMLKTERDQKNYFEELVSVRDNQLSRLQSELASLGEERERERGELEVVVLELQQELEKKHTELRSCQRKEQSHISRSRTLSVPPASRENSSATTHNSLHPPAAVPSGRKRHGSLSLFSGLLGSKTNN